VKKLAKSGVDLSSDERNLFSVAFKNLIGARRASWRVLSQLEQKEQQKHNEENLAVLRQYRHKVENEMLAICKDISDVLDRYLLPVANNSEARVFYQKMYLLSQVAALNIFVGRPTIIAMLQSFQLAMHVKTQQKGLCWRIEQRVKKQ